MSGENYRWGPEVVSEHVVRVRGKRRRRKVKDTGGCGSSQTTRRLSPLLKRPVWNHGAYPCLTAPHAISRRARWPCWPATTQLEQNESRVGFGVSSEEGRWDSLCFSQSRTIGTRKPRPWGCCQKAHSLTFFSLSKWKEFLISINMTQIPWKWIELWVYKSLSCPDIVLCMYNNWAL